jgi:hypothetical protein
MPDLLGHLIKMPGEQHLRGRFETDLIAPSTMSGGSTPFIASLNIHFAQPSLILTCGDRAIAISTSR